MKIINLTPHAIVETETKITYPPSGLVARVSSKSKQMEFTINDAPLFRTTYGEIEDLPDEVTGTVYLVSGIVLAATERKDLVAPGELVRDADGKPIGCKGFKIN